MPNGTVETLPSFLNPLTLATEIFVVIEDDGDCKFGSHYAVFICTDLFPLVILVGFANTSYIINETNGMLQVRVQAFNPPDTYPLPATVSLVVQTVSGSASKCTELALHLKVLMLYIH